MGGGELPAGASYPDGMKNPPGSDAPRARRRGRRVALLAGLMTAALLVAGIYSTRGLLREWLLIHRLSSKEADKGVVAELGKAGSDRAIPALLEVAATYRFDEERDRWGAMADEAHAALDKLIPRGKERATRHLLAALENPRVEVRRLAAELLGKPRMATVEVADGLVLALHDLDDTVQQQASRSLGALGEVAILPLKKFLQDPACELNWARLEALGRLGSDARALTPALIVRKQGESRRDVLSAIVGVGRASLAAAQSVGESVGEMASDSSNDGAHPVWESLAVGWLEKSAVAALRRALKSADPAVQERAVRALGSPGQRKMAQEAVPDLLERLKDQNPNVRIQACEALWWIEGEGSAAVPALVDLLNDPRAEVREGALSTLSYMRDEVPIANVEPLLNDSAASVRLQAAKLLETACGPDPRLLPACLEALEDHDSGGTYWATSLVAALGSRARSAVPGLTILLQNVDSATSRKALKALSAMGPDASAAVPVILDLLDTDYSDQFQVVSEALLRIAPQDLEFELRLLEVLRQRRGDLLLIAAATLWRIGKARDEALKVLRSSLRGGQDVPGDVRAAWASLGPEAIPDLIAALGDSSARTRDVAADVLGRLGSESPEVLEALKAVVLDSDCQVQQSAVYTLVSLHADPTTPLLRTLESSDPAVRYSSLDCVWTHELKGKTLEAPLERCLTDSDVRIRFAAAACRLRMDPNHAGAGRALVAAVRDGGLSGVPFYDVFHSALWELPRMAGAGAQALLAYLIRQGEIPEDSYSLQPNEDGSAPFVAPLAGALSSEDETMRYLAARLLKDCGAAGAPAVPALVARLDDPSLRVRARSALTLGTIGPAAAPLATEPLTRALGRRDDPLLRSNAACALGDLGPAAREAVPSLVAVVLDGREDEILRCLALEAVATVGGVAALDRRQLQSLATEGPALSKYVELLRPFLEDPSAGETQR